MAGLWPYCFWCFNTQPPEGGWLPIPLGQALRRSFNTQPPEGGWLPIPLGQALRRSFNTQPPEGGWILNTTSAFTSACFNTQPPEGGWFIESCDESTLTPFQHTAARRRLASGRFCGGRIGMVSTHSRPKAAGAKD